MKTVVLVNDLTFSDIGNKLYQKYLKLLEGDIKIHFSNPQTLVQVPCPGDKNGQSVDILEKLGLTYQKCTTCHSSYVNPRPRAELLEQFYAQSSACRFWRKETFKLPDAQRYHISGSRLHWVLECVDEYLSSPLAILDYETKYPNFISYLNDEKIFNSITVFKPKLYENFSLLPSHVIVTSEYKDVMNQVDIITAFETIERMFDPKVLFSDASRFCRQGGLLLFTTASSTGLEYQVLGKDALSLNPINRMNLLSIEALKNHVINAGFEILELSTPGRLDVDMIKEVVNKNKNLKIDSFWRYIFEARGEKTWQDLQNFLQENRLSSHVRVAARKL